MTKIMAIPLKYFVFLLPILTAGIVAVSIAGVGPPALDAIWADDVLYATVATPTELPDKGPKDGLYVFDVENFEGPEGQRPVAEAKPGDKDYNGGRWQVTVLKFTEEGISVHDSDGDGIVDFELTNWEQVEEHIGFGHFEVVGEGPSFVCPLIKKKN